MHDNVHYVNQGAPTTPVRLSVSAIPPPSVRLPLPPEHPETGQDPLYRVVQQAEDVVPLQTVAAVQFCELDDEC